jgi:surfeit locus 1 family protein
VRFQQAGGPAGQQQHEQQDGQRNPHGERARHALRIAIAAHQGKGRGHHTRDDADEQQQDDKSQLGTPEGAFDPYCNVDPVTPRTRGIPHGDQIAAAGLLILAAIFFGLSSWQWQRAGEARAVHERYEGAGDMPVLTALPRDFDIEQFRDQTLQLSGHYQPGVQFLIDNMTRQGAVGYHVLTPFVPDGGLDPVIVNRGWVAGHVDRTILPDVQIADNARTVRGRISTLPRPGLRLTAPPSVTDGTAVQVVSFPTMPELEDRLNTPLASFQLLLDPDDADGFVRDWRPAALPQERHIGYAVQWFGLALLVGGAGTVVVVRNFMERKK